jgi:hypothetical protein
MRAWLWVVALACGCGGETTRGIVVVHRDVSGASSGGSEEVTGGSEEQAASGGSEMVSEADGAVGTGGALMSASGHSEAGGAHSGGSTERGGAKVGGHSAAGGAIATGGSQGLGGGELSSGGTMGLGGELSGSGGAAIVDSGGVATGGSSDNGCCMTLTAHGASTPSGCFCYLSAILYCDPYVGPDADVSTGYSYSLVDSCSGPAGTGGSPVVDASPDVLATTLWGCAWDNNAGEADCRCYPHGIIGAFADPACPINTYINGNCYIYSDASVINRCDCYTSAHDPAGGLPVPSCPPPI